MIVDPFGASTHGDLFADGEMRSFLSEKRWLTAMVDVEVALAGAQAKCGVIPKDAAEAIAASAATFSADPQRVGTGMEDSGVPVPALVALLRHHVGGEAATFVHWGATSQDIVDTAQALVLRDVIGWLDTRLAAVSSALETLARAHADTLMLARTRMQQAAPTTFGLKVAGWRAPLVRHRARLDALRAPLLGAQLGGAAGTLAPLGSAGQAVRQAFAAELGLHNPAMPGHTQRDTLAEFAGWLSLVTGSLGKIGQDVSLLSQSEVAEVRETGAAGKGGSSTLPQKANPVSAEILVTLARYNAGQLGQMHQALVHEGERSGMAWSLEWLTLPGMILAASGALRKGERIGSDMVVNSARMRSNIDTTQGLCLAEAVSFALSEHMPRAKAQSIVSSACSVVLQEGQHLVDVVAGQTDAPVDWDRVRNPENWLGSARAFMEAALSDAPR